MSNAEVFVQPPLERELTPPSPRHILAVSAGNALEFYDFLTYAFFAAQIGRTFFPSTHAGASLLASLATFGAGFLMRPVGALVLGRVADRIGRKPAMLISFSLMGAAMVVLALTPGVAVIGLAAPIIVIICRLAQGFALGGEVGPSTAYLIEASPPEHRGLFVAFQYVGQQAAVLAAGLIGFGLSRFMSPAGLDAYGWRIALLVGAVIVPFGLSLRRSLPETLHAPEVAAPATGTALAGAAGRVRLVAVLGFLMLASGTTVTYVSNYLKTHATETLHLASDVGFLATITTGLMGVIFCPIGAWLSDRYGRRTILLPAWIYLALVGLPAFLGLNYLRSPVAVVGAAVLLGLGNSLAGPCMLVALTESLPKHIRGGGVGLIYALAIAIFGGSTQFTVAWLTGLTHSNLAPAWYMTAAVAAGVIAMLVLPETAPGVLARRKG